jgi:hypothetical protein
VAIIAGITPRTAIEIAVCLDLGRLPPRAWSAVTLVTLALGFSSGLHMLLAELILSLTALHSSIEKYRCCFPSAITRLAFHVALLCQDDAPGWL